MTDQDARRESRRGIFITFEGGDGAGKSTHLQLVAEALRLRGQQVVCLREPGGTIIGEQLRATVLDPGNYIMADECELLIYEAARAQLVKQVIRPALDAGKVVLCDRFADSTLAYQAAGRGIERAFVERANAFACQGVRPDRTILMMTGGDAELGLERATHHKHADRLEMAGTDFHERVNAAFARIACEDPGRVRLVVSDEGKPQTARKVFAELADLFEWMDGLLEDDAGYFEQLVARREALLRD